jgi:CMP-N-acetylneuraminic acid synthetase
LTGQIYGLSRKILFEKDDSISTLSGRIFPVITPRDTALDIDTEFDFILAEKVMQHFQQQTNNN